MFIIYIIVWSPFIVNGQHFFPIVLRQSIEKKKGKTQGKGKKRSTFGNKKGKGAGKRPGAKPPGGKGKREMGGGGRKRR